MPEMKRNVKDSVFTYLFRQPKYTRELYLALHPEDTSVTEEDVKIVTLEHILSNGQYNDLGVLVGGTLLVLVEAQSTFTVNVSLRLLMYLAQSYKEYVIEHELDLYASRAVSIPRPELYVVYTGTEGGRPDTLKLSSLYQGEGSLELTVRVLRQKGTGDILDQYIRFCEIQNGQRNLYGYTQKAIDETLRICREEGILTLFLASREKEVKDIMFTLFDQEWVAQVHEKNLLRETAQAAMQEGLREGKREGLREGKRETTLTTLRNIMESLNLSSDQAMAAMKVPASEQPEYRKLLELRQ